MSASVIGATGPAVDCLRHYEARNEADGVEEGDEKHDIGHDSVEKREQPAHEVALSAARVLVDCLDLGHTSSVRYDRKDRDEVARMPKARSKDFAGRLICP